MNAIANAVAETKWHIKHDAISELRGAAATFKHAALANKTCDMPTFDSMKAQIRAAARFEALLSSNAYLILTQKGLPNILLRQCEMIIQSKKKDVW